MNEKSALLGQLKINREEPVSDERAWLWPIVVLVLGMGVLLVFLWVREPIASARLVTASAAIAGSAGQARATVLDASGYVVARRQATVSAEMTGRVSEVLVEEGMQVKQGQVLAHLDAANAQAQLALARAREAAAAAVVGEIDVLAREAAQRLRRGAKLNAQGVLSTAELEAVQAEVDGLQARQLRVQRELEVATSARLVQQQFVDDHVIRAPFSGVVTVKAAQPGEMISPMSAGGSFTRTGVATLVDMDSLEVEVDVNENFINRVLAGQAATARLNAYPDWTIPAEVIAVVPAADRSKATVKVRIGLLEQDQRVLPDMGVRVAFLDGEDEEAGTLAKAMIPVEAVIRENQTALVFVWNNGVLERRALSLGAVQSGQQQVLAGLLPGESVVVPEPGLALSDGMRLNNREDDR